MKEEAAKLRVLSTAARLFQRQGYHATGMNQIIRESQAPKGSLYYYFPGGKEELAAEAVRWTRDLIAGKIARFLERYDEPVEAIQELIRATARELADPEKIIPCTISLLTLETSLASERLRTACLDANALWAGIFAQKLADGGFPPEDAEELGELIQMMIDGGMTRSLAQRDTRPLFLIAERLPALLYGKEG